MAEKKIDEHTEHGPVEVDAVSLLDVKRIPLDDTLPVQKPFHPGLPSELTIPPWIPAAVWLIPGVICIRYFCNPATFRRRATVLGVGATMAWFNQYIIFKAVRPALDKMLSVKDNMSPEKWEDLQTLWLPYVYWHPDVRKVHQKAIEQYVSDEIVSRYIERERIRDKESALSEVLAFKWRNLWSSIQTRAAIDNLLKNILEPLTLRFDIPDRDVRHCVSYVGAMLEQPDSGDVHVVQSLWVGSVLAGVVFSNPWVLRTAAAIGFCSGLGNVALMIHLGQLWTDIDKYSKWESRMALHMTYFHAYGPKDPPAA